MQQPPLFHFFPHLRQVILPSLFQDFLRDPEEGLGDAAGHGGQGIGIPAQGDGVPQGVLEILRLQEGLQGLGYGTFTGGVPLITVPDVLHP